MSAEDIDKWASDSQNQDVDLTRSCSCFEMLDPHDPVISRLATQLFQKTGNYLQEEMIAGQESYTLLEHMNRLLITKHADLRNLAVNLSKTLNDYNEMYAVHIKPLLHQIDDIDSQVSKLEANAYRLDSYTKQLKSAYRSLHENM